MKKLTAKDYLRVPDLAWYQAQSKSSHSPLRCPFASEKLCPRYYHTLALLGSKLVFEKLSASQEKALDDHWDRSVLFSRNFQPQPELIGSSSDSSPTVSSWWHCCPELAFDAWNVFASCGRHLGDNDDKRIHHAELDSKNVPKEDYRWQFPYLNPRHYSECKEFAILDHCSRGGVSKGRSRQVGAISPKKRWEVLARDNHTCIYCGRRPPEVRLHVDHKISVCNKGSSEDENLVTSCDECNLGKGKRNA